MKGSGILYNDPDMNLRAYNNTIFNTINSMKPYNNGHVNDVVAQNCAFYNNYIDKPIVKTSWIEEKNNLYSSEYFLQDRNNGNYLPLPNSALIDKSIVIDELKDILFIGKAPDIGAYELGLKTWKVGSYSNVATK